MDSGRLRRVGRGWFATPMAVADAERAIQLGGRLGCLSGCKSHGLWVPEQPDLHVVVPTGMPMPAPRSQVQFHRWAGRCSAAVADLADCLAQVLHRHDPETGLIVLESAVNLGQLAEADARALISGAPARNRRGLQHFRLGAMSGSETRLRLYFQRRRIPVLEQAFIPGVGSVDLLVGRSLIVEADSQSHHGKEADVHLDRERDLEARQLGYDSVRFSPRQLWQLWDRTQTFLAGVISTGRHLRPPDPMRFGPGLVHNSSSTCRSARYEPERHVYEEL